MYDLKRIRPLNNHVLIELDKLFNERIQHNTLTLLVNTNYQPEKHIMLYGKIIAVPPMLKRMKDNPGETMEWGTSIEVDPGDEVLVDYYAILMSLGSKANKAIEYEFPKYFEQGGKYYVFIHYRDLFGRVDSDNDVYPLNGYVMIEELPWEKPKSDSIIIPDVIKDKRNLAMGRVIRYGRSNDWYYTDAYHEPKFGTDIKAGDTVVFKKAVRRKIEDPYHKKLDKEYLMIQGRFLNARIK